MAMALMALFAYDQEYTSKKRYLSDERFMQISEKLKEKLSVLSMNYSDSSKPESPIEKALQGIGELLTSPDVNIEHLKTLRFIYECLNTSDFLSSSPIREGDLPTDEEQKVIFTVIINLEMVS